MKYTVDPTWWRRSGSEGETVVGGSPVRIFRLSAAAAPLLDALEAGLDVDTATQTLQSRLIEAGAIHPRSGPVPVEYSTADIPTLADVTVLIPAHVSDATCVRDLVASLPEVAEIIVVDDGSPTPIVDVPRARIVRHDHPMGPAAARNRALGEVSSPIVLFLDHDISLPGHASLASFWTPLLFHLTDPRVAIVAPRVRSAPGPSALARYEVERSPLDMGPHPARVAAGTRVSYVPSAALAVRTQVLRDLHGFDEGLRYGEDVDLVWRANDADHICRYEPDVVVVHEPRPDWRSLLTQRFHYGTSAAQLEARHPGSARPVRINTWSAVIVALALIGRPLVASGVAATTFVRLARRLRSIPDRWLVAARLVGRGHVFAGRTVLEASIRTWWPLTLLACSASRRARRIVALFVVIRSLVRRDRGQADQRLDPVRYACAQAADDVAYGAGVWFAAVTNKNPDCLTPRFD